MRYLTSMTKAKKMMTTLRHNACRAFSCKPTPQRKWLANAVLIGLAFVVVAMIGVIHAGARADAAKQAHATAYEAACASAPPEVERTSHQN